MLFFHISPNIFDIYKFFFLNHGVAYIQPCSVVSHHKSDISGTVTWEWRYFNHKSYYQFLKIFPVITPLN